MVVWVVCEWYCAIKNGIMERKKVVLLMRTLSRCALCNKEVALELSHIVPKFAIRRLKKTSIGAIRNADNPNAVVQDGEKHYMLCGECEDLFSKYETYFSNNIFHPYLNNTSSEFSYDEKLYRFITSVSWRSTYLDILDYVEHGSCEIGLLECLIENEKIMRDFLLGRRNDLAHIENHIFFFEDIKSIYGKTTEEIQELRPHASIHRGISSYTASYGHVTTCGNITNMMGIILFTLFKKGEKELWVNTEISNGNGLIFAKDQNITSLMGNDLNYLMEQAKNISEKISDKQMQNISKRLSNVGEEITKAEIYQDWVKDSKINTQE